MTSKPSKGRWAKLIIAVPLVVLIVAVALTQAYVIDTDPSPQVQLLGYHYGIGLSVTLSNPSKTQLTIQQVTYDGKALVQGQIGGVIPVYAVANSSSSSLCNLPVNALVFPTAGQWNMDTGGLCTATIPGGADPTLYLGVASIPNSTHVLGIVTQIANYTFTMQEMANYTYTPVT